jgi:1-acyl-sn-glycerol-3-phosphate acyltransferase
VFYTIIRAIGRPLARLLFWPIIVGLDKVPATGPVILAANHLGIGEPMLLVSEVPHHLTFPAKKELFRTNTPFRAVVAWILRRLRQVPMDRAGGMAALGALGSIHDVLQRGGYVAILPEGHRSPDGRLYKGHTGVARLALSCQATLVPVGCFRTRFARRKWLPFPWLFRPELRFGEPFQFPQAWYQEYQQADNQAQSSAVLRRATDEVMRRIQAITGQEMVDDYSLRPRATPPGPQAAGPDR